MLPPVATLCPTDRPRERLWSLGPAALTTAELLAILLGTGSGGSSVLEIAAWGARVRCLNNMGETLL